MQQKQISFAYDLYNAAVELPAADAALVAAARNSTNNAYAPYSHFYVGAAARLVNGEIITGSNQENASYPVGICAERVLLSAASSQFPGTAIEAIAVSYSNHNGESNVPLSPCGMCRQSLVEYEDRQHSEIKIILSGMEGEVFVMHGAKHLLPLSFTGKDLK
ncbi:MAG TPA: cytidine deaminase [Chitinophagaceae bacterium]|nr:cytidine deaminase [Chitinophagaceae bacterium]